MQTKLYVLRLIKVLNEDHDNALNRKGGWQYAQLLNRALIALEALAGVL